MNASACSAFGLELDTLTKRYGDQLIVNGIDLQVRQGEFIVLLGESGCGKSTTLRMIAGLENVSAGHIRIAGREVTDLAPGQRNIAMVFQNYALYPHMSVAENMSFSLRLAGLPAAQIQERVERAADTLNMRHLLERKPGALSGGQRQRVAIGRAIVREPEVFLFDEPLSNLDAKLRSHMRTELSLLHRRLGKTTVYVTHDQVEAMTLADRIVLMNGGNINQVGTPEEIYLRPANRFVATFIGMPGMNLLPCRVEDTGGPRRLRAPGVDLPCPPRFATGQKLIAGLRPSVLEPCDGIGEIRLPVNVVEFLGNESVLIGSLATGETVRVCMPGQQHALLQHTLALRVNDADACHYFDPETGVRL